MADRVGQQLGNYHLLRKLGQGAFAEVYLGEHLYLERLAAIKVLHIQMDEETQEQFRREARTIAHLQHPHILQAHDFGIQEQTPYLVMEYTPGGTLRSQYPKGTRLSYEQIVMYVKQIASALDYAHQQRVIHRDVKPDNVLLTTAGGIMLSDFGLAIVQRSLESLSVHPLAGTPLYIAPEQIQLHPCAASDQYALGIMVYEWLRGEPPFRGTLYEVVSSHLTQPPPSLCAALPDLPAAMEDVVFKALAKNPEQRFACVTDFAEALEEARIASRPPFQRAATDPQWEQQAASPGTFMEPTQGLTFSTRPIPLKGQLGGHGSEAGAVVPNVFSENGAQSVMVSAHSPQPHHPLLRKGVRLIVLLTITGSLSLYMMSVLFPVGYGFAYIYEALLSLILFAVSIRGIRTQSFLPRIILCVVAVAALLVTFAGLNIGYVDMHYALISIIIIPSDELLTLGLAVSAVISLLWFVYSFTSIDRITWILCLTLFGIAALCSFLQYPISDSLVSKHILLLITLNTLIAAVLLAAPKK